MVPFECDLCVFRKLRKHSPDRSQSEQRLLLACMRRMILDAFWSRASPTVRGNRDNARMAMELSRLVGLSGTAVHDGPLPDYDHCGYEVAIQMLLKSRSPGKHSKEHCQFDAIRKICSSHGNQVRASPQANRQVLSLSDQSGRHQRLSLDPCGSFWFSRFVEGCRHRMGSIWKPNQALSTELLHALLSNAEGRIEASPSKSDQNRWVVFHAHAVVTYVASLRGPEGFLLDLEGLIQNRNRGKDLYEVIALRGKIKGEHHDRCHLIPSVPVTKSGVQVRFALNRLMALKQEQGFVDGPAISDETGHVYSTRALDDCLHEILEELFDLNRELFPPVITTKEELKKRYQVFRTFRRTSDSRALEEKVGSDDIDVVNRWKSVERAKGARPTRTMRQHYADLSLLLKPFLRHTGSM